MRHQAVGQPLDHLLGGGFQIIAQVILDALLTAEFLQQTEIQLNQPVAGRITGQGTFIAAAVLHLAIQKVGAETGNLIDIQSVHFQLDAHTSLVALGCVQPRRHGKVAATLAHLL